MNSNKFDMRIYSEMYSFTEFRIIISSLMPIIIEMDNDVRFSSQRDNDYY
jgi:hypothetical protein